MKCVCVWQPAIDCEQCAAVSPGLAVGCGLEPAARQQLGAEEGWINKAIKDALSQAEVERRGGSAQTGPWLLGAAMQRRWGAARRGGGVTGQQSQSTYTRINETPAPAQCPPCEGPAA